MQGVKSFKRQNIILGTIYFFFSKKKYIDMAVAHAIACSIEVNQQRPIAEERVAEQIAKWEMDLREDYTEMTDSISSALWSSFWIVLSLILTSASLAFYVGSIRVDYPIDLVKIIAYIGSSLVGWAAIMELGNDFAVYDGPAFPQLVHKVIFMMIFVPGVFFILLSILL